MPLIYLVSRAASFLLSSGTRISNEYRDRTGTLGISIEATTAQKTNSVTVGCGLAINTKVAASQLGVASFCNLQVVNRSGVSAQRPICYIVQAASLSCIQNVARPNYFIDLGAST